MEQKRKTIEVNASSLVDLKAELLRKQEELRQKKLQKNASAENRDSKPITGKKGPLLNKKIVSLAENSHADSEETIEEADALDRARKALAEKANLYERLSKGDFVPEEDGSQIYLVDFQQKAINVITERRRNHSTVSATANEAVSDVRKEENLMADVDSYSAKSPDDEWVEYTDSLGRSRRCMRKELASLVEMDQQLAGNKRPKFSDSEEGGNLELLSADMRRELERQKWEKEAEVEVSGPTGPVHYANVQFNEVRDHGVGFFGFATDEDTRQKQLDALKELRAQTQSKREKHDRLKDKRRQVLAARLEKVKQRRIVKDVELDIDLDPMAVEGDDGVKAGDKEPEQLVRDDSWRQSAPTRDWDKHKKQVFDEKSWLEKQREERLPEFAPPVIYEHQRAFSAHRRKGTKLLRGPVPAAEEDPARGGAKEDETYSDANTAAPNACRVAGDVDRMPSFVLSDVSFSVSSIPLPSDDAALRSDVQPVEQTFGDVSFSLYGTSYAYDPFAGQGSAEGFGESVENVGFSCTQNVAPVELNVNLVQPVVPVLTDKVDNNDSAHGMKTSKVSDFKPPQPAHYSSAPMKPQPKGPKYEAVNLHEIPLTLPAPPSAGCVPHYPSQEEVIASNRTTSHVKSEQSAIKQWQLQFDRQFRAPRAAAAAAASGFSQKPSETSLRPKSIPFASPYIQKQDAGKIEDDEAASLFDPAKPPPDFEMNN